MEIYFSKKNMHKIFNTFEELKKKFGVELAKKISQRLFEFIAADSLNDLSHLPPVRLHELNGKRKGQLSVDLKQPYRLIFTPKHDPIPIKDDGGIDRLQVTEILILEVVNYHD